ncbi:hypothetical protein [Cupriavidus pampae]|jgi:hypothetical protein|uniref:Uncharacterized protein n=1 Tax=Cupriavidus pampae TaxID=659251 RepID=A0ABN7ZI10_9BURK|nr:hypothetical protein [Cupriavidus pampae]CAG9183911.1 hypothetical protein LMG32289_05460 [Cupriavidus pampae]
MNAREAEAALLDRCATVARSTLPLARDQREANVFRLASMVVQSRFPGEATQLMGASTAYFAAHPGEQLAAADVVRRGWVSNLPRLRDMLSRQLQLG